MQMELEEHDLENNNNDEILPKPPLFLYEPLNSQDDQLTLRDEKEEDPCTELHEKDKWRMFHELRQKKKKLMKEANPFASLKIPPPPLP